MIRLLNEKDREIIMEYLGRNEVGTSFLYGNVVEFGIENDPEKGRCADYYGYFEREELRGILPFYNLGSCIPHFESEGAVEPFVELIKGRKVKVLMGMKKELQPLYEGIKDDKEIRELDESVYMVNKNFKPHDIEGITFIDVKKEIHNQEIVDFMLEGRIKGFQNEMSEEELKKSIMQRAEEEDEIAAVIDGKLVAQANVQTYTPAINQVGGVYTPEQYRSKGYGKAVVSEICRRIIKRGKMPTLFAVKENTPAIRAYTNIGFTPYDDYLFIKFK